VLDLDRQLRPLRPERQTAEVTVGADGFTRLSPFPGEHGYRLTRSAL
jgi:hypothetical protein